MCNSGNCKWEVNDYNNGGTLCRKPAYMICQEDLEDMEGEDDEDN